MGPSPEKLQELKQKYSDRSLHLIEAVDGSDELAQFVITGPTVDEYKKFNDEVLSAKDSKTEGDRASALRGAVERAALAQIRFPDRETCQSMFNARPAMVYGFAEELHKAAGSNIELRSKKL